ncbi:DUF397 domain-containing protein [Streptomyces sp. JJ38]|nr:DUF397 domain-containing protein [Streptomyces sp. JJ38]
MRGEVEALNHQIHGTSVGGGDCVETAALPHAVAVRDSKRPDGPVLSLSPAAFTAFVRAATAADLRPHAL